MKCWKIIAFISSLVMTACITKEANPNIDVVSPLEFQTRLINDPDAYLLDVRKPAEYETGHISGAHLMNWLDNKSFMHDAGTIDKSKTIYVYCRSGRRSNEAARYLANQGYKVVDLDGGILAWSDAGLPVVNQR